MLEHYPEMVCREPLPELEADVVPVTSLEQAETYWEICEASYSSLGFPPGVFEEAFAAEELLDEEHVWACLGLLDGSPAACASLFPAEGVGMVGWVAAKPEARGEGLAAACTVRVTNRSFELGLDVASLQASEMGEELYRRLGYEDLFDYKLYGAMPEA